MNPHTSLHRRAFLAAGAQSVAAMAFSLRVSARTHAAFRIPGEQARAISVGREGGLATAVDREIWLGTLEGKTLRSVAVEAPARALCHDAESCLWMTCGDQVARMAATGAIEKIGPPLGSDAALVGIAVAEDGRIFVADSAARAIWRLDARGSGLGQLRPGQNGFAVPRAFFPIAWQRGQLVVAEPARHRVQRLTAEGERVAQWGARSRAEGGFAGCCNPVSIAALADGSIVTAERGQGRVKRFDADGKFIHQLAGPETFPRVAAEENEDDASGCEGGLLDLAATSDGRVVVLDRAACMVHVLG
jgi:hypothetical protein